MEVIHHVYQALRAHALYKRDVDYVVKDGEVIIVDEFTGRQMPGRRWSDGLHQAVEAKENVKIERENQTLATITFQNYFRMYKKLSGMTGTAETEAAEFAKIYNLDVVVIPTNRALIRKEYPDVVYRTEKEKFHAVVNGIMQEDDSYANGIRHFHDRGQPVLVGTISIEKSEAIADILKKAGIPHQVLNAKQHERESRVVAQAGRKGAVTVATNMAGRGTDILLGGNPEQMTRDHFLKNKMAMPYSAAPAVIPADGDMINAAGEIAQPIAPMVLFQHEGKIFQVPADQWKPAYEQFAQQCKAEHDEVVALGGLHILGTERHEARRIDNQLRGRAGRQGDPGSSRFFLSLEDDLMRIFGGERVKALMFRLGMTEGVPIESGLISRRIENAQKSVEAQNFDARKHLLEYDDVMNKQRETIYAIRRSALEGKDQRDYVLGIAEDVARELVNTYCPREQHPDQWNTTQFLAEVNSQFGIDAKAYGADPTALTHDQLGDATAEAVVKRYEEKEKQFGADLMRWLERRIILDVVDSQWKDHLLSLDHLKEGIGLRGYAQKDPHRRVQEGSLRPFRRHDGAHRQRNHSLSLPHPDSARRTTRAARPTTPGAAASARANASATHRWRASRRCQRRRTCRRTAASTFTRRSAPTRTPAATPAKRSAISDRRRPGRTAQARPRRCKSRPQRPMSLRLRQKIQKMPRHQRMTARLRSPDGPQNPV